MNTEESGFIAHPLDCCIIIGRFDAQAAAVRRITGVRSQDKRSMVKLLEMIQKTWLTSRSITTALVLTRTQSSKIWPC
jgi:hypothetical protein